MDEKHVKKDAYLKVARACEWIIQQAEKGDYAGEDKYIGKFPIKDKLGVMPVAEILMCLANIIEPQYRDLKLPKPTPDLIVKITEELLLVFETHGFTGYPYLRTPENIPAPSFTDAVCYLAGALNATLKVKDEQDTQIIKDDLRSKCEALLLKCLDWLLGAKIDLDLGSAWAWSSPLEIKRNNDLRKIFENMLPPQTYFSAQTLTTLNEILFENYDLLDQKKIEETFKAIVGAKSFLLNTISKNNRGWPDFLHEGIKYSALLPNDHAIKSEMSLYPLESLSYWKYYAQGKAYKQVASKLTESYPKLFSDYVSFTAEHLTKLNKVFNECIDMPKLETLFKLQCVMQLPPPLNNTDSDKKNYYVDGTVAYNVLNTFNFYVDSFSPEPEDLKAWLNGQTELVKRIIDNSFKDEGFVHFDSDDKLPAIYATRTAIASLLSWNLIPPENDVKVDNKVRGLIAELYSLIVGEHCEDVISPTATTVSEREIENLMILSFVVGGILMKLNNKDWLTKAQNTNLKKFFGIRAKPEIREKIREANGIYLIKVLKEMFVLGDKASIDKIIEHGEIIATPYRTIFNNNLEGPTLDKERRAEQIKLLTDRIIEQFATDGMDIEDIYVR